MRSIPFVLAALLAEMLAATGMAGAAGQAPAVVVAARAGDAAGLRAAVRKPADVNASEPDGTTALHWAAQRSDLAAIDLLLHAGARVDVRNRYGVTPLWLAASRGDAIVLERLLRAGADANMRMAEGDTVLMNAARSGSAAAARALLAHGADPNAMESWKGQSALMWAAAENHAAVMDALLEAGARIDLRSKTGTLENPGEGGYAALHFAARGDAAAAVRLLLQKGVSINEPAADGATPLILAVASGHFDLAQVLLDAGADPNADGVGWTALHELVWIRRPQTSLNHPGKVPHGTVESLALVKLLLAHGANVNTRMTKEPDRRYIGRNPGLYVDATPFFVAAKSVDVAMMKLLVSSGADPNLPNVEKTTPLMAAAGVGINGPGENPGTQDEFTEAVRFCLQIGGDPNAIDLQGDTALHGAALRGADRVVELLAAAGATLNVRNKPRGTRGQEGGFTPWRIAAGVYMNGAARQQLQTADLLRQLLKERGLSAE